MAAASVGSHRGHQPRRGAALALGRSFAGALILTIAVLYAAPFVKGLLVQQPPSASVTALPSLSVPALPMPLLRVPHVVPAPAASKGHRSHRTRPEQ